MAKMLSTFVFCFVSLHEGRCQAALRAPSAPRQLVLCERDYFYNNLWPGYENTYGRTWCPVVARCCREFRHPDGSRCLTYLIEYNGAYFPIKHTGLLDCISQQVRRTLPVQRP